MANPSIKQQLNDLITCTIREYMTLPAQTMESIEILEEHGTLLIKKDAADLLAGMVFVPATTWLPR